MSAAFLFNTVSSARHRGRPHTDPGAGLFLRLQVLPPCALALGSSFALHSPIGHDAAPFSLAGARRPAFPYATVLPRLRRPDRTPASLFQERLRHPPVRAMRPRPRPGERL